MFTNKLFQPLSIGLLITMCLSVPRAVPQITEEQQELINGRLNQVASLLAIPLDDHSRGDDSHDENRPHEEAAPEQQADGAGSQDVYVAVCRSC